MFTKFNLVYRLLVTLVITSLLLAPITSIFAADDAIHSTNTLSFSQAVPPPLGPPAPRDPIPDLSVKLLTYGREKGPCNLNDPNDPTDTCGLEDAIQDEVDKLNTQIKADENKNDVRATVSWSFNYIGHPGMAATEYPNRPNENFVDIPYMIDYYIRDIAIHTELGWVSAPNPDRHLFQSINLQMFCDQWQTGHGRLKLVGKAQQPFLGDPGTLEQILNIFFLNYLTPMIDNEVRQYLPPSRKSPIDLPDDVHPQCDTIGRYSSNPPLRKLGFNQMVVSSIIDAAKAEP